MLVFVRFIVLCDGDWYFFWRGCKVFEGVLVGSDMIDLFCRNICLIVG